MIYNYILYIIFILLSALVDAEHIENKQYFTDHISRFALRFIVTIMASDTIIDFLIYGLLFWLLFDIILNLLMKRSIFYVGNTAWIDKQFNKIPIVYFLLKIIVLTISVICYI